MFTNRYDDELYQSEQRERESTTVVVEVVIKSGAADATSILL